MENYWYGEVSCAYFFFIAPSADFHGLKAQNLVVLFAELLPVFLFTFIFSPYVHISCTSSRNEEGGFVPMSIGICCLLLLLVSLRWKQRFLCLLHFFLFQSKHFLCHRHPFPSRPLILFGSFSSSRLYHSSPCVPLHHDRCVWVNEFPSPIFPCIIHSPI